MSKRECGCMGELMVCVRVKERMKGEVCDDRNCKRDREV